MRKGQLTVEYLIILVAMLLLFSNISMDLMQFSLSNTLQIQTNELLRTTNFFLNSSANEISLQGPGAKKTVYLRPPSDCDYVVGSDRITLSCASNTASANYSGLVIGQTPPKVSYFCPACTNSMIKSGVLESVEIVKNA